MRAVLFILLIHLAFLMHAQQSEQDVPMGVIKVRKDSVLPFFKVQYHLALAHVNTTEVLVPAANGMPGVFERFTVPVYDSLRYPSSMERVFPKKELNVSRSLAKEVTYAYPADDSLSIDTITVDYWIGKNGKIKFAWVDTTASGTMPREMEVRLYQYLSRLQDWGVGGGYMTPRKFLRRPELIGESYYCRMYVIVSSRPITAEQKKLGIRYNTFDEPLEAPRDDNGTDNGGRGDLGRNDTRR